MKKTLSDEFLAHATINGVSPFLFLKFGLIFVYFNSSATISERLFQQAM
jgi:hypothetical protein